MVTEHLCVTCSVLRPGEPRIYERANVCDGCRSRLRAMLGEVVELYGNVSLERPQTGGDRVSGSRTPPVPLNLDALDITMPPHPGAVVTDLVPLYDTVTVEVGVWQPARPDLPYGMDREQRSQRVRRRDDRGILAYGLDGDQVGEIGVAARLDLIARDWQTYDWALLPPPSVAGLASWIALRLDDGCDRHPAIDEFAVELREILRTLRRINGLAGPSVDLLDVPCRRCDWLSLAPVPRQDRIECLHCGDLATGDEYQRWLGLLTAGVRDQWVDFDLDALLYVDEAALLVKVTQNTVRLWVGRGVLEVAERDHGRPRFRARDVFEAERHTRSGVLAS